MRGWEGLYGRPQGDRVPPNWKQDEQDAGDHKGPPNPTSTALAPTDVDGLVGRVMCIGRPSRSPWSLIWGRTSSRFRARNRLPFGRFQ